MLHVRKRCLSGNDMGKVGILLTPVAGIGAAVVFQDLLRLGDHHQVPVDQLFANALEGAAALAADALGFRQIEDELLYRKVLRQLVNGVLLLAGITSIINSGGQTCLYGSLHLLHFHYIVYLFL